MARMCLTPHLKKLIIRSNLSRFNSVRRFNFITCPYHHKSVLDGKPYIANQSLCANLSMKREQELREQEKRLKHKEYMEEQRKEKNLEKPQQKQRHFNTANAVIISAEGLGINCDRKTGEFTVNAREGVNGRLTFNLNYFPPKFVDQSPIELYAVEVLPPISGLNVPSSAFESESDPDYATDESTNLALAVLGPGSSCGFVSLEYTFPEPARRRSALRFLFRRKTAPDLSSEEKVEKDRETSQQQQQKQDNHSFVVTRVLSVNVVPAKDSGDAFELSFDGTSLGQLENELSSSVGTSFKFIDCEVSEKSAMSSAVHTMTMQHPLDEFEVPSVYHTLAKCDYVDSSDLAPEVQEFCIDLRLMLSEPLTVKNHYSKLSRLLFIEEIALQKELRRNNIDRIEIERDPKNQNYLKVNLPDLPEEALAFMTGNYMYLHAMKDPPHLIFQGIIYKVVEDSLYCGSFNQSFFRPNCLSWRYDVQFSMDRFSIRLQHRALKLLNKFNMFKVVFPDAAAPQQPPLYDGPIECYNKRILGNKEQKQAVMEIVRATCRPAPYIVYGPPGTGKTVTLIESIIQVVKKVPNATVLACAPSEIAADRLALLLSQFFLPQSLLRLNSLTRDMNAIPPELKEFCNIHPKKQNLIVPAASKIRGSSIVICSLASSGHLVSSIPCGHFTHIFIDEAAQATEPEAMIPLAGLFNVSALNGLIVIAGDRRQLGPVVQSQLARESKLGMSWLERLSDTCAVYQRDASDKYNPRFITKLVENYRSHDALLKLPNTLFYHRELQACADKAVTYSLCSWPDLVSPDFPLVFHGVRGEEWRSDNGQSYFNDTEITHVMNYVDKLLLTRANKGATKLVTPKDIGIISPYKAQVLKIRQLLRRNSLMYEGILAGSVEEFQGSERLVIILSTVRSKASESQRLSPTDKGWELEFLMNPKRFNTAITRAKALLIVVGDPFVLEKDAIWRSFIRYACDNRAYKGVEYSTEPPSIEPPASSTVLETQQTLDVRQITNN